MRPAPPEIDELLAAAHVVSLPMRVRFRGVTRREALLLRGPAGWGEFAPFPEYDDAEAARWLHSALDAAWQGHPAPRRTQVPVNATVPAVPAGRVPAVLAAFDGCTTVKVKVAEAGQDLADDLARVRAVREVLGEQGVIRVDANGGWTVGQAHRALAALGEYRLAYAEQPCRTVPELVDLADRLAASGVDVPLAADEAIRKAEDPLLVARTGAVRYAVVKVAPLGGVRALLAVADALAALDVQVVVSSALDTSVGIGAGVAAAAALPQEPPACGLGTVALLDGDVTSRPLVPAGGLLPVRPVDADPDLLERHRAEPGRHRWWLDRLTRCHRLLQTQPETRPQTQIQTQTQTGPQAPARHSPASTRPAPSAEPEELA